MTGSTSEGLDAFWSALLKASTWSSGYVGGVARKPDWTMGRLVRWSDGKNDAYLVSTDPVLSSKMRPSMPMLCC